MRGIIGWEWFQTLREESGRIIFGLSFLAGHVTQPLWPAREVPYAAIPIVATPTVGVGGSTISRGHSTEDLTGGLAKDRAVAIDLRSLEAFADERSGN